MSGRSRFRRELRSAYRPRPLAELSASGVTKAMLAGPGWRRTSRGFYVPSLPPQATSDRAGRPEHTLTPTQRILTPTQRILDAAACIPDEGALTGWAAAFVYGVDLLDGLDSRTMAPLPVPICTGRDLGRRSTPQVAFSRERLPASDVRLLAGLRLASPERTAFDGARFAPDLGEAVAFVDSCAHAGLVELAGLSGFAADRRGWTGVGQALRAIGLADAAARSPGESRLRVLYVVEAGLPRPEVNVPIFDLGGRLLGIADLLDIGAGLVTEYDGGEHRLRRQHNRDNVREERLERAGLVVVRADGLDLAEARADLVARLRDGRLRGLRRDRRYDAWTTTEPEWWAAQVDPASGLTAAERAYLFGD